MEGKSQTRIGELREVGIVWKKTLKKNGTGTMRC